MFITLEGIEGAGKSTIMHMLAEAIRERDMPCLFTREPGGSNLGRMFRSVLLDSRNGDISPDAELFLFLADRAQHIKEIILPALNSGKMVFCDRFSDSTIAYQGYARGLDIEFLKNVDAMARGGLEPDMTILLDLPVSSGLARAKLRNKEEGTGVSEGRFDAESLDFHGRVRNGYLQLARENPGRFRIIDADRNLDEVFRDCLEALKSSLN